MQLKNLFMVLGLIFATALPGHAAESTRENFLKVTGLKLGPVDLVEGPVECRFSTLGLIEIGDGSISLMTGANPLITGLGMKAERYKERGCEMTEAAEYKERTASFRKKQDCSGKVFEYYVSLGVSDAGFAYTRLNKEDGKQVLNYTCKYRYATSAL